MSEIINMFVEIALFICSVCLVYTKQDIRVIVLACALYIAAVIRNNGREDW